MKVTTSILLLLICALMVKAQIKAVLPLDERGKLIYYEVVPVQTPPDSLKIRVLNYLQKQNKTLKFKTAIGDAAFVARGKMIIHKTLFVISHPSGEVLYTFNVEIKDGKYRFWATDFEFISYQRDRYGNFVPNTTIGIPLENNPGKLNTAEWREYHSQTANHVKDLASKFKIYLANKLPILEPTTERQVVKKEW